MDDKDDLDTTTDIRKFRLEFAQRLLDYRVESYHKLMAWLKELGHEETDVSSYLLNILQMTRGDIEDHG